MRKLICLISLIAVSFGAIAQDDLFIDRYLKARGSKIWEGKNTVVRHMEYHIYDMNSAEEKAKLESEVPGVLEHRCIPYNLKEMYLLTDTPSASTVTKEAVLQMAKDYEELFSLEKKEKQAYILADVKDNRMSEIFIYGFKDDGIFILGISFHEAIPKEEWMDIAFNSSANSVEELEQADEVEFSLNYKGDNPCMDFYKNKENKEEEE